MSADGDVDDRAASERGAHERPVRVLSSKLVVRGRIFDVVDDHVVLPSGLEQQLWIVSHPGAVGVVPILDDGRVVLVRQYRHAVGAWLTEIPAGRLDRDEAPEAAARRELEEETGLRCSKLEPLGMVYPAPGFCSERMFLFVARGLVEAESDRAAHDPDEEIDVLRLAPADALAAAANDAKSWIALKRALSDCTQSDCTPSD